MRLLRYWFQNKDQRTINQCAILWILALLGMKKKKHSKFKCNMYLLFKEKKQQMNEAKKWAFLLISNSTMVWTMRRFWKHALYLELPGMHHKFFSLDRINGQHIFSSQEYRFSDFFFFCREYYCLNFKPRTTWIWWKCSKFLELFFGAL